MKKFFKIAYCLLVYLFLYAPIVVIIWYSFNDSKRSLLWHGFTWKWYEELVHDVPLLIVALHSLTIGILSATLATILGTLISTALTKYKFLGKRTLYTTSFMLVITPDIVLGIALLMIYSFFAIPLGFWSLLLAHTTFCLPFVIIIVYSRLKSLNKNLFEAAKDLGARDSIIFFRVLVPQLLPSLIASWLISFTLSLDDVIISYFVSGPTFEILPLKIYSLARMGVSPELNALCTVLFLVTLCMVIISQLITRGRKCD